MNKGTVTITIEEYERFKEMEENREKIYVEIDDGHGRFRYGYLGSFNIQGEYLMKHECWKTLLRKLLNTAGHIQRLTSLVGELETSIQDLELMTPKQFKKYKRNKK